MSDDSETPPDAKKTRDKWRIQAWIYDETEDSRIRNCEAAVGRLEGYADLSDFIVQSVMKEVTRLEKKRNGGRPFPPPPESVHRRGRGRAPRPGKAVE
ncbi:hypothetical protein GCM10009789_83220 [Kribbella sancticallisti]|uniref:ParB-like C-terminal domain-containing protein n=1 Tax=Kribbella sancticallisti TaxID=460087 RepID=A0ABN2ESN9_9ACTN